jgi:hypothetical protein
MRNKHCLDLTIVRPRVEPSIRYIMRQLYRTPCKVSLGIKVKFYKYDEDLDVEQEKYAYKVIPQRRIFSEYDADEALDVAFEVFDRFLEEWSEHGSGWNLMEIDSFYYNVSLVKPICGSCGGIVDLPPKLAK